MGLSHDIGSVDCNGMACIINSKVDLQRRSDSRPRMKHEKNIITRLDFVIKFFNQYI